ncbi:hypothetical protein H5410_050661, partial [Solanum commersonii]
EVAVTGICEEVEAAEVLEGPEARVGEDAFTGIESISTSEDVLNVTNVNEGGWDNIKILAVSRGIPARRHNFMISTGKGKEVCFCLAITPRKLDQEFFFCRNLPEAVNHDRVHEL